MKTPVPSVRVWLALAALATATAFVASYHVIQQSQISSTSVQRTQRTLSALIAVEGALADLVFASGDVAVGRASTEVFNRLADLSALTLDNAAQQRRIQRVHRAIEEIVDLRVRRGTTNTPEETRVRQTLSRAVRELRLEELRLLTQRVDAAQATSRQLTTILIVLATGSGVLLVWVFVLAVRDERKRRENEDTLRRANQELDARVSARTVELHDALERERELRAEAESSSRLKDEFLMTVSHELRTPLNVLVGWADMLRLGAVPDDRRERALTAIYENAKLQAQLIDDLLDTARILTAKLRIEAMPIDVGQIVEEAVSVIAPAAEAKGLAIDVQRDERGATVVGDPLRLRQVVWNLVSNAVKFTRQGRISVRVTGNATGDELLIIVGDSGIGIAPEFLPHVFERFRQESRGTTRSHGGLGLGLAIVKQLVELHGGRVGVASNGEGQGAVFTVTLPARPVSRRDVDETGLADVRAAAIGPRDAPALDGTRVLIVDDDAAARELVAATLERYGASVTAARSADEARRVIDTQPCDVLLVDIAMPGEDGYSFVRTLRARGVSQPAAALTAHAHATDRMRALESGFDEHITKPIGTASLAHAVARLARARREPSMDSR